MNLQNKYYYFVTCRTESPEVDFCCPCQSNSTNGGHALDAKGNLLLKFYDWHWNQRNVQSWKLFSVRVISILHFVTPYLYIIPIQFSCRELRSSSPTWQPGLALAMRTLRIVFRLSSCRMHTYNYTWKPLTTQKSAVITYPIYSIWWENSDTNNSPAVELLILFQRNLTI